jgi:hypothetical protein
MNPDEESLKVPPVSLILMLKRQRPGTSSSLWWKSGAVTEEEWEAVPREQQAPPETQPTKEKTPPKLKPLKAVKAPHSRVGRVQIRLNPQVRKNGICKVKTAAVRAENIEVVTGMLSRVVCSGKLQVPNVVHVKKS